ncbi:MAG: DUF1579 family protein, partial [Armatimonadetes bacterium]|nr:DUF1579 family protein [Armatimonadota bacterium]
MSVGIVIMMLALTLLLLTGTTEMTQNLTPQTKPAVDGSHDLDFWLGTWTADSTQYTPGQPDQKPTFNKNYVANTITRSMKDQVIHERFDGKTMNFNGESWSVYNKQTGQWQQTWVDDSGGYIPLTGGKIGKDFILTTLNGKSRMRFHNITKDSFDWMWEGQAKDGSGKWVPLWLLNYKR